MHPWRIHRWRRWHVIVPHHVLWCDVFWRLAACNHSHHAQSRNGVAGIDFILDLIEQCDNEKSIAI